MMKSEVRKRQWEIGESVYSSLQKSRVLTGNVGEIIQICGIKATGNAVGKFLQRAQTMQHTPFTVKRTHLHQSSAPRCTYRITLKTK
ncbi:MAG: hypothetical protein LUQ40_04825 [Methanomicrobiales archaeon]|nr:hypothetical protein [Methanomicrobiales archaeon]